MHQRVSFVPIFLLSLGFVLFIFLLGRLGFFGFFTNSMQAVFFPFGSLVRQEVVKAVSTPSELTTLQEENTKLREQLVTLKQLQSDNVALRDQFQTVAPAPQQLLPARVVGMPNVVPNVTFPDAFIINVGQKEGVKKGDVVVVGNELLGSITAISAHYATVALITSPQSNFSAQTVNTNARGIARGQGNGELIIGNVLLSDTLQVGDTVITTGGQNASGAGFPPNLVVGKIVNVDKNPSSLFQDARVVPLVTLTTVENVFVLMQ